MTVREAEIGYPIVWGRPRYITSNVMVVIITCPYCDARHGYAWPRNAPTDHEMFQWALCDTGEHTRGFTLRQRPRGQSPEPPQEQLLEEGTQMLSLDMKAIIAALKDFEDDLGERHRGNILTVSVHRGGDPIISFLPIWGDDFAPIQAAMKTAAIAGLRQRADLLQ